MSYILIPTLNCFERMMHIMGKEESRFITAAEVADVMGVSMATGYRIIKSLNDELKAKGFIVVAGKCSRKLFYERVSI